MDNYKKGMVRTSYTKEYRTLLEKLLEIQVRLTEIKGDPKLKAKIEPLIDKLIFYFNKQVDKTLLLHKQFDSQWDNDSDDS